MQVADAKIRWAGVDALIFGSYVLLAVIFTYPLILTLNTHVAGLTGDSEEYLWAFWWMRKAVVELHTNPFFTTWLYYPQGVSLYFFAFNPLHALFSVPLQALFGLIAAYNLLALLTFSAAAWAAYLLARDITGSRRAAFVAGIVFAFAPTQVFHFSVGQPNLYAVEFIPVYGLCLRRWLNRGGPGWLIGGAVALALSSLADWQFAVYLQLFTAAALIGALLARRRAWWMAARDLGRRTLVLEVLYVLAVSPVLVPMVRELSAPHPYMFRGRDDTASHSADLLAFFVPNPEHPLWREWSKQRLLRITEPGVLVTTVSLSYVALVLAVIGALHNWRQARFWVFCGLGFLILALGPKLRVLGQETAIHLPYEILFQIPLIKISRAPARYTIITLLCLAVLAALGVQAILKRRPAPGRNRIAPLHAPVSSLWLVMLGALCFELLPVPVRVELPAPPPPFFTDGTLRGAGALLELPDPSKRGMYLATLHGRPVLYGELSRDNPVSHDLAFLRAGLLADDAEIFDYVQNWRCIAGYYNISHLVLYRTIPPAAPATEHLVASRLGEAALLRDTPEAALYRIPPVDSGSTCLLPGEGWDRPRQFGADRPFYRWTAQRATLGLMRREPGRVILRFKTHSFAIPRRLEVWRDGALLARFAVGGEPLPHAVELDLPAGVTWIELRSVEPASAPSDYGYNERTPVAIGYSDVVVEPTARR